MGYPAVLHDPVSGATRRVTVTWDSALQGDLRVDDGNSTPRDVAAADLSLSRGGWSGDAINFRGNTKARCGQLLLTINKQLRS